MAFFPEIVATGNAQPPESPFYYPDKENRDLTKVNYKRNGAGQDKVNSQKEIETFLNGSKSKARQRKQSVVFG